MSLSQEYANENMKHRAGGGNRRNKVNKKKKTRSNSGEIAICQALQNICGAYYKVNGGLISMLKIERKKLIVIFRIIGYDWLSTGK